MDQRDERPAENDVRCTCGRLMARLVAAGVELKCRRCKRVVLVRLPRAGGGWVEVPMS